jgi:ribosomal protein S18 acetylase RimI-like enzyme
MVNILVFHQKDKLVGSAQVVQGSLTEKHLGKFGIALSKDYRGFGLGKALMQLTLTEAKKKLTGLEIIELSVWKRNKVARNLYRQFGFKKYGALPKGVKTPDGYDDHIFMYLDISQLD